MSKVWFVTGAASGLGAGIARAVLASGARLIATDLDVDRLRSTLAGDADRLLNANSRKRDVGRDVSW